MRRIIPRHIEQKKNRIKQFFVGGVLIAIMIISTLGYALNREKTDEKKIDYNGLKFVQQNGLWFATIGETQFAFRFNPEETENISLDISLTINSYSQKPLYISSNNSDAEIELYRNLDQIILRRQYACLEGEICGENLPAKTCDDNFIIIQQAEISKIEQKQNCVFIQGKGEELLRLTDGFLFKILGVQ